VPNIESRCKSTKTRTSSDRLTANGKISVYFLHALETRKKISKHWAEFFNCRVVGQIVGDGPKSTLVRDQFKGVLFHLLKWQGKNSLYVFSCSAVRRSSRFQPVKQFGEDVHKRLGSRCDCIRSGANRICGVSQRLPSHIVQEVRGRGAEQRQRNPRNARRVESERIGSTENP
jgi:hypothetical protein